MQTLTMLARRVSQGTSLPGTDTGSAVSRNDIEPRADDHDRLIVLADVEHELVGFLSHCNDLNAAGFSIDVLWRFIRSLECRAAGSLMSTVYKSPGDG